MSVTQPLSAEETAQRGDEIYERQIEPHLGSDVHGKIVAVDVETGAYALAETAVAAARLLRAQHSRAEVWFVRVGSPALHQIGAWSLRDRQRSPGQ